MWLIRLKYIISKWWNWFFSRELRIAGQPLDFHVNGPHILSVHQKIFLYQHLSVLSLSNMPGKLGNIHSSLKNWRRSQHSTFEGFPFRQDLVELAIRSLKRCRFKWPLNRQFCRHGIAPSQRHKTRDMQTGRKTVTFGPNQFDAVLFITCKRFFKYWCVWAGKICDICRIFATKLHIVLCTAIIEHWKLVKA